RLREDLEQHFVDSYRTTEARLIEIERVLYPQLKTIVEAIVPGSGIQVSQDYASPTNPFPTLTTLSETAVLDLDVPWWKLWFSARPDPARRAADLRALIHEEFLPTADDLARQAESRLNARVTRTLQQANAVSTGMLTAIQQRRAQVLKDFEALTAAEGSPDGNRFEVEQRAKVERCAQRHTAVVELVDELTRLAAICQQALNPEARS
ncbi:MAG: hypothetical protein AB7G35_19900, partial [Hyphomicrobiaceae bacterium]